MARKKYGRRAAKGEGHIRQRKDGRWEYLYTDKSGEPKSAYGKSEAEVWEKKRAIQSALHDGTYVDPSSYTVSTWADYFFEELYLQPNAGTRANVIGHINNHIKPFFKTMKLQDVDSEDVVRFQRYLLRKDITPKTITNIHATLYQVFQSAIPKRIKSNPAAGNLHVKRRSTKEVRVFTEEEQFECEALISDSSVCPLVEMYFFLLALLTGMREAEIIGLDWAHVDFDTGTIYIHQQLKRLKRVDGKLEMPPKQFIWLVRNKVSLQ